MPIKNNHGTFAVLFHPAAPSLVTYDLKKTGSGKTRLYAILEDDSSSQNRQSIVISQNGKNKGEIFANATSHADLEPELWGSNIYDIYLKICGSPSDNSTCTQKYLQSYAAEMGAADVLVLRSNGSVRVVELISPNTISMLWQVPQYLIITVGEALFSITGLEFSYSEASPSMKSVLTAIWLLTTAFGNVIDMIISGSGMMKNDPAGEFFVYASLMTVVMLVFIGLAWRYKSVSESGRRRTSVDDGHQESESELRKTHPSAKALSQLE